MPIFLFIKIKQLEMKKIYEAALKELLKKDPDKIPHESKVH